MLLIPNILSFIIKEQRDHARNRFHSPSCSLSLPHSLRTSHPCTRHPCVGGYSQAAACVVRGLSEEVATNGPPMGVTSWRVLSQRIAFTSSRPYNESSFREKSIYCCAKLLYIAKATHNNKSSILCHVTEPLHGIGRLRQVLHINGGV